MTEELIYPFEFLEVDLSGIRWAVTGTAILKPDIDQVYTEPGWIAVEQLDRLDAEGNLDYEDFPRNLLEASHLLDLVGAVVVKLNNRTDDLNQWFYERIMNDEN